MFSQQLPKPLSYLIDTLTEDLGTFPLLVAPVVDRHHAGDQRCSAQSHFKVNVA
jgi:hypothetical protein